MDLKKIQEPYDLIKVPYDWLPDRLIKKTGVDGRWLFEDFITNNLICDYETFWIDTDGQVILERISHTVELVNNLPHVHKRSIMERLKTKNKQPTVIKARLFKDESVWIKMTFDGGVIKEIHYEEK